MLYGTVMEDSTDAVVFTGVQLCFRGRSLLSFVFEGKEMHICSGQGFSEQGKVVPPRLQAVFLPGIAMA